MKQGNRENKNNKAYYIRYRATELRYILFFFQLAPVFEFSIFSDFTIMIQISIYT